MTTYSINAENNEVTQYTGYDALAFERIGNKHYAVCKDGIYYLGGQGEPYIDTDNGAEISATVTLGATDFKSQQLKRVQYAYVGMKGDITLAMMIDTGAFTADYRATHDAQGVHQKRIKMGLGNKSRYWTPSIKNVAGKYFELDSLGLDPVETSRRVS